MPFSLDNLISFVRIGIDDNDPIYQDYGDKDIRDAIRFAVQIVEAEWKQNYTISSEVVEGIEYYYVDPEPSTAMQMIYTLKAIIMIRTFEVMNSYSVPAIKITKTSKAEDLKAINGLYEQVMYENRYSGVEKVFTTWDDYNTRIDRILKYMK